MPWGPTLNEPIRSVNTDAASSSITISSIWAALSAAAIAYLIAGTEISRIEGIAILLLALSFLLLLRSCEAFVDAMEEVTDERRRLQSYLYGLFIYNEAVCLLLVGFGVVVTATFWAKVHEPTWRIILTAAFVLMWLWWAIYWLRDVIYVRKWYRENSSEN